MTGADDDIGKWPEALEAAARAGGVFARVAVLRETRSTQDAARRLGARPGDVVVAARQTDGRGRMGRAWADTRDAGVAVTLALPAASSERLAIAVAIGVAEALERLVAGEGRLRAVGIKWPNDIIARDRKLAGILVEQSGGVALAGIGVNVAQVEWPADLAGRAVSLRELGSSAGRLEVMCAVMAGVGGAIDRPPADLAAAFGPRDVLAGGCGRFRSGGQEYDGRVIRVDPMHGLVVEVGGREVRLPAAQTTVVSTRRGGR